MPATALDMLADLFSQHIHVPVKAICGQTDMSNPGKTHHRSRSHQDRDHRRHGGEQPHLVACPAGVPARGWPVAGPGALADLPGGLRVRPAADGTSAAGAPSCFSSKAGSRPGGVFTSFCNGHYLEYPPHPGRAALAPRNHLAAPHRADVSLPVAGPAARRLTEAYAAG